MQQTFVAETGTQKMNRSVQILASDWGLMVGSI